MHVWNDRSSGSGRGGDQRGLLHGWMTESTLAERSAATLSRVSRPYAVAFLVLSMVVAFTGNGFLAILGMLCAVMLLNGANGAGPLVPLAMLTSIAAAVQLFLAFGLFITIMVGSPNHFCTRANQLVVYAQGSTQEWNATATEAAFSASGTIAATEGESKTTAHMISIASQGAPEPPSSGARAVAADHVHPSACIPPSAVQELACGPNAQAVILGFAFVVLTYALLIVLPMFYLALKVGRLARGAGGCNEFAVPEPMYVVVQGHRPPAAAVGVPVRQATGLPVTGSVPAARPISAENVGNLPVATACQMH